MEVALGLLLIAISLIAFASAAVPRWRGSIRWQGTCVPTGPISCVGFGLAFAGGGLLLLVGDTMPGPYRSCLVLALLAGFPTVFVGQWRDFRRAARTRPTARRR